MNSLVVIFGALVGLVCCCSAMDPAMKRCEEEGPAVYCMTDLRAGLCRKTLFCKSYLRDVICPKGPEIYCKLQRTAFECGKQEFCAVWLKERATTKGAGESFWEYVTRIYGNAMINFRSRRGGY